MRREKKVPTALRPLRSWQGRTYQHRYADRLRCESRLDCGRRNRRPQPVYGFAPQEFDGAGSRCASRVRAGARRGVESNRQPAGAVRLWRAGRRQYCACSRAGGSAGNIRQRHQEGLRTGREDRDAAGLAGVSRYTSEGLLCRSRPRPDRTAVATAAAASPPAATTLAAVEPPRPPSRETPSKEALDWDRVKEAPIRRNCRNSSSAFLIHRWRSTPSNGWIF